MPDPSRIPPDRSKAIALILGAYVLGMPALFVVRSIPVLSDILVLGCVLAVVIGCALYVRSKGWRPAWGILGVIPILGVIAVLVFPDRRKRSLQAELSP